MNYIESNELSTSFHHQFRCPWTPICFEYTVWEWLLKDIWIHLVSFLICFSCIQILAAILCQQIWLDMNMARAMMCQYLFKLYFKSLFWVYTILNWCSNLLDLNSKSWKPNSNYPNFNSEFWIEIHSIQISIQKRQQLGFGMRRGWCSLPGETSEIRIVPRVSYHLVSARGEAEL